MPAVSGRTPSFVEKGLDVVHSAVRSTRRIKGRRLSVQHRADVIRINLLQRYGGVWCDASLWCNKPLDDWLPHHMASQFFAFSSLSDAYISNWFLAAQCGSYIAEALNSAVRQYWSEHTRADQYF